MTLIQAYHRPHDLADALTLLARPDVRSAVLAGGARVNSSAEGVQELVDLQALGLDAVQHEGTRMTLGAMVRLQALVDDLDAPMILRETARRAGPNTLRHQATIGGVVASADPESELLAAMLVCEASVTIATLAGQRVQSLSQFLADGRAALAGGIITDVALATDGVAASERVARTPADRPIVAAVARKTPDGRAMLALCGVATTPVLIHPDDIAALDPPADFRGSSEYRRAMAGVLAGRVLSILK